MMRSSMVEERVTYCRICEPLCGMVATVEDGRLVKLRPDRDHPVSKGFACPKGIAFTEVHNDPDRVLHPLRRKPGGGFERVTWEAAMADITSRLKRIVSAHGGDSVGWYFGNPSAFSASHTIWLAAFMNMLGSPHSFSAGSQDVNNRFVASQLLYGTQIVAPVPDLARTDFLVILGANPVVSHGSVVTAPRFKDELHGIVGRGGRVLVVDPRRTETARAFEWLPITPDGDAFLLLAMLHVLFEEGLAVTDQARGAGALRRLAGPFVPEAVEEHTGIDPGIVRKLARELAAAERASIYGRTGTCLGRNGTLTAFLIDAVNLVAGNLDVEGGAMFGDLGIPGFRSLTGLAQRLLPIGYDARRSRIGGFPQVLGTEPASLMAKEITTPGDGQVRALFVSAGNPVLSVPDGDELEAALDELELMVSLDLYVNETNAHADYVLPATTMYEREDFPIAFQTLQTTPLRQATGRVVEPAGEAREEWEVIEELMGALWRASPVLAAAEAGRKVLGAIGMRVTPRLVVDAAIRLAEGGDRLGLRPGGLSFASLLRDHPHGKVVREHLRPGMLRDVVVYRDRRVRLDHPQIAEEVARLRERGGDPAFPLHLIGMRELRSENSWMHNAPLLLRGGRTHTARMHPDDAAAVGVADGDAVRLTSRKGAIELPVTVTPDIKRGVVAVPHGWGHKGTGGWRNANAAGGVNVNRLMSTDPGDLERLAGMAHLNGVPVRAERVPAAAPELAGSAAAGAQR
jgi:anaerobic selenocysteine-containing dehydrogenase